MATAPSMSRSAAGVLEAFDFLGLVVQVPRVLTGRPALPASDLGGLLARLGANAPGPSAPPGRLRPLFRTALA
jgi:hypothetical protein